MSQKEDYILFLSKWYPNQKDPQLGVFVQKHAELLAKKHRVVVIYLCPFWNSKKPKVNFHQKGRLEEYIVYYRPFQGFMKLFNPYMYYNFQREVFSSIEGNVKHCFVNIGAKTGFLPYFSLRKRGVEYSLIEHWSGFVNGKFHKKSGYKKRFYKKLATKAKSVFAVSEFLKSGMQKELEIASIRILPNVIEQKSLSGYENTNDSTILIIGDLVDEIKNISGIINSFQSFIEVQPEYTLHIVGDGESRNKLKSLVSEKGLDKKVVFKGRLNNKEVLEEITKCKFLVSNSNFETFGMAQAEALLAGKPVVSSRSGGPNEFLTFENSISFEIGDDEALLRSMLEMHQGYNRFDSKKISRSISEKFDRDTTLSILESEFIP